MARYDFEDSLREDAVEAVATLRQNRIETVILSGDRAGSVAAVAAQLGIDVARSGLTPQQKVEAIQDLGAKGSVAMVGDGINDAVALRAADVSFAPAAAADVGRAAADFVLTGDRLGGVPFALWLARQADGLVRQNLALSMVYNVVVLPLAAAGMVTPLMAAIAMSVVLAAGGAQRAAPATDARARQPEERTMSGLVLLVASALTLGAMALAAFFWALRNGQYDDIEGAAQRILIDDEDGPKGRP